MWWHHLFSAPTTPTPPPMAEHRKAKAKLDLHQPGVVPLGGKLILEWITQREHGICLFQCFPPFLQMYFLSKKQKDPFKPTSPPPHTYHLIVYQENDILQVPGSSVILILHIYCTLLRELGGEESFVVHICSGYCLCRSDWMREQWVSFQFLMSTSNYLFNFMPGEALYSYTQNHFTSFVMLCFRGDWLAFQLTALITTWIWLHCRGINIMQQSI